MLSRKPKSTSKKTLSFSQTEPVYSGREPLAFVTSPWLSSHRLMPLSSSPLITHRVARLVLETLEPLSGDRKCFRMINGVLVERTVKDVVPALQTNADGLKKVLDDLVKSYRVKQDELEKWKVCQDAPHVPSSLPV
jgi:hypothetical protein